MIKFSFFRCAYVVSSIFLCALALTGWHIDQNEKQRLQLKAKAPRYLYVVQPATGKIVTNSIVSGDISLEGDGFVIHKGTSTAFGSVPWDGCWYSNFAACRNQLASVKILSNPVGAKLKLILTGYGTYRMLLPRIFWIDQQGNFQNQLFLDSEVVYISDHPLLHTDGVLLLPEQGKN